MLKSSQTADLHILYMHNDRRTQTQETGHSLMTALNPFLISDRVTITITVTISIMFSEQALSACCTCVDYSKATSTDSICLPFSTLSLNWTSFSVIQALNSPPGTPPNPAPEPPPRARRVSAPSSPLLLWWPDWLHSIWIVFRLAPTSGVRFLRELYVHCKFI